MTLFPKSTDFGAFFQEVCPQLLYNISKDGRRCSSKQKVPPDAREDEEFSAIVEEYFSLSTFQIILSYRRYAVDYQRLHFTGLMNPT